MRKKLIRGFYAELITSIIGSLIFAVGACFMLSLLVDFLRINGASKGDLVDLLFIILVPIVSVVSIVQNFSKFKRVDVFKQMPLLPEKSYYDYL